MPPQHHFPPPIILIADDDLGFVFWLALMLAQAGYRTFPATHAREGLKIISELQVSVVDLLILNQAWNGAPKLMEMLQSRQGPLKVIQIENRDRDAADTDATRSEWIDRVERALEQVQSSDDVS